ncbi:MAG TPA: hypothetical protein VK533_16145 [Sphingomonas sp.]|uniref:hypothetical protein n=1 Tax=Sphingomonas sp. TaxID=28214 RepID=UPI002CBC22EC|nr:hypothetical protein [Sphingomonas sp.]HMI21064.1 hypothetical protein [Sphingomonas sp.]
MTEDKAPPTPLPPEAEPPYPPHGAAAQRDEALEHLPEGPAIGALGVTLIGGAVAATVGLLLAIPLLRRKKKPAAAAPKAKAAPRARRPRRKRTD